MGGRSSLWSILGNQMAPLLGGAAAGAISGGGDAAGRGALAGAGNLVTAAFLGDAVNVLTEKDDGGIYYGKKKGDTENTYSGSTGNSGSVDMELAEGVDDSNSNKTKSKWIVSGGNDASSAGVLG